jgi:hypothetical protein
MKLSATERTGRNFWPNSPKEIAIELLGELRVVKAAPALVEDINYHPMGESGAPKLPIDYFPCVQALIKIGLPATKAIFEKCENKIEDKNLILYAWVISYVDGDEVGKYRIELELKKTKDPTKKRNLEQLLKVYKTKKTSFPLDDFGPRQDNKKKKQPKESASQDVRKEEPESNQPQQKGEIAKPTANEEALQAQERTDWPVPALSIAVVVLAGLVVFLLLRGKRANKQ